MPSQTSYAQLWLYNNAEDKQQLFESFRENLDGTAATSNMMKIDSLLSQANTRMTTAEGDIDTLQGNVSSVQSSITELESDVESLQNAITELQDDSSLTTAKATSTDNSNYTATVEGMTEYKTNMVMVIYLGSTNTGAVTVNVNSLGAKNLMKIGSAGTAVALEAEDLKANVGYLFQYDGTQFVLLQEVTVKDLYKTFLEFEETDEVVPPAPIDVDMLGGIPAANYLQKIYNAGSNNMLVNPRFKYNSRDQSSYTGTAWGLDGWYCANITQTGNILTSSSADSAIQQPIKGADMLLGKTATISIAVQGQDIAQTSCSIPSPAPSSTTTFGSTTTTWGSIALWYDSSVSQIKFSINVSNGQSITVNGVKLELGSTSTLQADLDNPPSEDIEKLKLDMYDLDPGRCAYLPWHNENLLDNWYFIGGGSQQNGGQFPINQRGETSWSTGGYHLDRWKQEIDGSGELGEEGFTPAVTQTMATTQQVEESVFKRLLGKKVTISALLTSGEFRSRTVQFPSDISQGFTELVAFSNGGEIGIASYPDTKTYQLCRIYIPSDSNKLTFVAIKVEIGYLSTLASKNEAGNWILNDAPPSFEEELSKCQRYCQVLDGFGWIGVGTIDNMVASGRAIEGPSGATKYSGQCIIPLVTTMRTSPSMGGLIRVYKSGAVNTIVDSNSVVGYSGLDVNLSFAVTTNTLLSSGDVLFCHINSGEKIIFSADL